MNCRKMLLSARSAAESAALAVLIPLAAVFAALFFIICRVTGVELEE